MFFFGWDKLGARFYTDWDVFVTLVRFFYLKFHFFSGGGGKEPKMPET